MHHSGLEVGRAHARVAWRIDGCYSVAQIGSPESGDNALFYANFHHLGALSCGRARRPLPERSLP